LLFMRGWWEVVGVFVFVCVLVDGGGCGGADERGERRARGRGLQRHDKKKHLWKDLLLEINSSELLHS